jgi:beta-lactamase superfamily II metal-dependent hydrolase
MRFIGAIVATLGFLIVPATSSGQGRADAARLNPATFDVIDVGQGDAVLIRSPEGKAALIDAGSRKEIVLQLRRLGVRSIDLVVVTHHHADHYGGMDDVIRAFHPRVFLATGSSHSTPKYLKLLTLVRDSGIQAIFPTERPRKIELGSILLTILPQPPEDKADENDNSIGIRVRYGSFSMLLTGDSQARERAFWEQTVPDLIRNCTVLKLAHHGSRNGTDARWLEVVRPKLAVVSLGRGNEFGHPHAETLALLERRGIPLLRTDQDGTITVISDGKRSDISRHPDIVRWPPVSDEQFGVAGSQKRHPRGSEQPSRLINVNTASQKELESLPGVGLVIARRIIEGRPYRSVDDLLRVKGIGAKRLEEIRPLVGVK